MGKLHDAPHHSLPLSLEKRADTAPAAPMPATGLDAVLATDALLLRLCADAQEQASKAERLAARLAQDHRRDASVLEARLHRALRAATTLASHAMACTPRTPEGLAAMAELALRLADKDEQGHCLSRCTGPCPALAVAAHVAGKPRKEPCHGQAAEAPR